MKIITNNQPRPILYWAALTDKEKQEFDWLTGKEQYFASFFRYKGQVYCLDEFVRTESDGELSEWDGISHDSVFSGVLVKIIHGFDDEVIVGRYYS